MRHSLTNLIALVVAAGIAACGDSPGDDKPLSAALDGPEAVVDVAFRYGAAIFVVTGVGDAEILLTYVPFDGTNVSLVARRYNADLQAIGSDTVLAQSTNRVISDLSACGRVDGSFSVAWVDVTPLDLLPDGVHLDYINGFANVVLSNGSASGAFRIHPNQIGIQSPTDIACLSNGRAAVAWMNRCEAIEKRGTTVFSRLPEECATEPVDGTYLRVFGATGEPVAPAQEVLVGQGLTPNASLAATSDGGFALITDTLLETRDADGRAVASVEMSRGPGREGHLECPTDDACVGLFGNDEIGVHVRRFDPHDLGSAVDTEVVPVVREAPRVIVIPRTPTMSCDESGHCLIAWLTQRERRYSDYVESESLGIDACILDANTGELGPTTRLVETAAYFWGAPKVSALGTRRFVLAYDVADAIMLHTVVAARD